MNRKSSDRSPDALRRVARALPIASLRGQLIAIVAAFALCFVGLTLYAFDRFVRTERDLGRAQLVANARAMALAIERELDVSRAALTVLSRTQSLATADFQRFHRLASDSAADLGTEGFFAVFSRDAQLMTTRVPLGTPLAYSPGPSREAIDAGRERISDLYVPPQVGRSTVVVSVPVTIGGTAKPEHALSFVTPVERLSSLLGAQEFPAAWVAVVADGKGRVLARSRAADQLVGRPMPEAFQRQVAQGGASGMLEMTSLEGERVEGAFARVANTGWIVAVSRPAHFGAGGATLPQAMPLFGTALALLVIALVAAAALSRQILRPLEELGDAARDIGEGRGEAPAMPSAMRLRETRPIADALAETHEGVVRARDAQRQHADELREMAEALEARVRDRTEKLEAQTQALRDAQVAAEAASQAKSTFLAQMSHEIRTPMTAVLALADLLLLDAERPRDAERLRLLRSSAASLRGLLDDVLDFAKIESGRIELDRVAFSPRELVADVVGLFRPLASTKDCFISFDATEAPVRAVADAARLRQVLVNLIGNAVKFTDNGRIDVRVWSDPPRSAAVRRLRFRVTDSGIGVTEEARQRIFLPFEQGDAETARRFGGAGLGLAICRELVTAMGGRILVEGAPTGGTAFEFDVTATPPDGSEPEHEAPVLPAHRVPAGVGAQRVLIAEDNDVTREVERTILEREGNSVVAVADGLEAVRAAAAERFDVIVLDIRMPQMDGVTAAREIRRAGRSVGVPIIALSADPLAFRSQELAGLFDAVLEKPIDWAKLSLAIRGEGRGAAVADAVPSAGQRDDPPHEEPGVPAGDAYAAEEAHDGWDRRVIQRLGRGKSEDALRTLLADFVAACRRQLDALWASHEDGDDGRFREEAHMLAGLAATFGWTRVARAARDLEHAQGDARRASVLRQLDAAMRQFDADRFVSAALVSA